KGLETPGIKMIKSLLSDFRRFRPKKLGSYFNSRIAASTLSLVFPDTMSGLLIYLDTVATENFASFVISYIITTSATSLSTMSVLLIYLDTVASETFASFATSCIVTTSATSLSTSSVIDYIFNITSHHIFVNSFWKFSKKYYYFSKCRRIKRYEQHSRIFSFDTYLRFIFQRLL